MNKKKRCYILKMRKVGIDYEEENIHFNDDIFAAFCRHSKSSTSNTAFAGNQITMNPFFAALFAVVGISVGVKNIWELIK